MALIYDLDGYGLKMQVFDDHCVIKSKESFASYFIGKGFVGEKEIYFKDVTTVQYRKAGFLTGNGFIQFEYAGGYAMASSYSSENSFIFAKGVNDLEKIEKAYEYIRKRITYYKKNPIPATKTVPSVADELLKLKALMDEGIISQEEFDIKKKELLAL